MGPPGHVFGFGTYGRVGSFLVLGTYGGWVATLENPFGTLEALETLGTLCVALCGDKVRTNFLVAIHKPEVLISRTPERLMIFLLSTSTCLCSCSIVAAIWMVRDDMRDARIVS